MAKDNTMSFSVSYEEKMLIKAHAERRGMNLSEHIREILLEAEKQDRAQNP